MCGIAGVITLKPKDGVDRSYLVDEMLRLMAQRGPDGRGLDKIGAVTLGNTRLSIVDHKGGSQPFKSTCRNLTVTLNGQIYNYKSLKKELIGKHNFVSNSDTEILLHLYEEKGIGFLDSLNGMFSFCISDGNHTYLVRDRLGIKPLYYRIDSSSIFFSSEIKPLLTKDREINIEPTYSNFETNIGDETIFAGIYSLPSGHYLEINSAEGRVELKQYYSLTNIFPTETSISDVVDKFRWLLTDAIRLRTDTDLPFGCYVSGGMDSALVAYYSKSQHWFSSITKDRPHLDEEYYFDLLRDKTSATHTIKFLPDPSSFRKYFVEMIYALEKPVTTLSAFVQYLLSQRVSEYGFRIMLTGLGADEYLGGYVRHAALVVNDNNILQRQFPEYAELYKVLNSDRPQSPISKYIKLINRGNDLPSETYNTIENLFAKQKHSLINSIAATDFRISFPDLLDTDDRINMWFGIETRAPFLDYRLIEYAFSLMDNLKVRIDPKNNRVITKYILRKAFGEIVPFPEVIQRKDKVGFPSPVFFWLQYEYHDSIPRALRILEENQTLRKLILSWELNSHDEFDRKPWQVLQLAAWYLLFIKRLPVEEVEELLFGENYILPVPISKKQAEAMAS